MYQSQGQFNKKESLTPAFQSERQMEKVPDTSVLVARTQYEDINVDLFALDQKCRFDRRSRAALDQK